MSYIDTFAHERVGFFAGLPIYRALETVKGSDDPEYDGEFGLEPNHLVLGGGQGEWPAMILRRPDAACAEYVTTVIADWEDRDGWEDRIEPLFGQTGVFEYVGWDTPTHHAFYERCTSPAMIVPFDADRLEMGFSWWLQHVFGEFIMHAMPELAGPEIGALGIGPDDLGPPIFRGILLEPPGTRDFAQSRSA